VTWTYVKIRSCLPEDLIQGGSSQLPRVQPHRESENPSLIANYQPKFEECLSHSVAKVLQAKVEYLQRRGTSKAKQKAEKYVKAIRLFHCDGTYLSEIAFLRLGAI
jgi:hypothetical protein